MSEPSFPSAPIDSGARSPSVAPQGGEQLARSSHPPALAEASRAADAMTPRAPEDAGSLPASLSGEEACPSSIGRVRPMLLDDPFSQLLAPPRAQPGATRRLVDTASASALDQEPPSRRSDRLKGFVLQIAGAEPLVCTDVRGFREASAAAADRRALVPSRLVLVAPEGEPCVWLERWAEDADQVRRTVTISRRFDGKEVKVIATLSSYGYGVETSLFVDSVLKAGRPASILRSGVHLIADVEAALARYDAEELESCGTVKEPITQRGAPARVASLVPRTPDSPET